MRGQFQAANDSCGASSQLVGCLALCPLPAGARTRQKLNSDENQNRQFELEVTVTHWDCSKHQARHGIDLQVICGLGLGHLQTPLVDEKSLNPPHSARINW
jgi:hypothetical protein